MSMVGAGVPGVPGCRGADREVTSASMPPEVTAGVDPLRGGG